MAISTDNTKLFQAILAMDVYSRGYNAGLSSSGSSSGLAASGLGLAAISTEGLSLNAQSNSFYAARGNATRAPADGGVAGARTGSGEALSGIKTSKGCNSW